MTELPRLDPKEAIALLTSTVTEVDELRRQVVAARSMLLSIQSEASVESETGDERGGEPTHESMTITELAEAIGVRASTLRYWESEGLTAPDRGVPDLEPRVSIGSKRSETRGSLRRCGPAGTAYTRSAQRWQWCESSVVRVRCSLQSMADWVTWGCAGRRSCGARGFSPARSPMDIPALTP